MSKDSKYLNEIKTNLEYAQKSGVIGHGWGQSIEWLIEKVEKQQQEIENLNREIGGHSGTLDAIAEEFNFLTGRLKELQNKMVNQ